MVYRMDRYLKGSSRDEEAELCGQKPDSLGQRGVLVLDAVGLVDQQVTPSKGGGIPKHTKAATTAWNNG